MLRANQSSERVFRERPRQIGGERGARWLDSASHTHTQHGLARAGGGRQATTEPGSRARAEVSGNAHPSTSAVFGPPLLARWERVRRLALSLSHCRPRVRRVPLAGPIGNTTATHLELRRIDSEFATSPWTLLHQKINVFLRGGTHTFDCAWKSQL